MRYLGILNERLSISLLVHHIICREKTTSNKQLIGNMARLMCMIHPYNPPPTFTRRTIEG